MSTITSALSSPPLTIPIKKSDPFDWIGHCRYILDQAGIDCNEFISEIHELNHMRNRCLGSGADKIGFQLHCKYFSQLTKLTTRFVVVDVQGSQQPFKWFDAYDSSLQMEQSSIAYEKANFLFNASAILSQMAASHPNSTADELNGVYSAFQGSASIIHFIKEHFLHPPLHDISKPSLDFLSQLMMAQAQEAASKKAILLYLSGDNGQDQETSYKVISRLWQSSAIHFSMALKFWYAPNATKIREHVQETVPQLIDQKYRLATVLTLYYSAQWKYGEEKVGEAISRLNGAIELCKESRENDGALSRQFMCLEKDILVELKKKLERDNGFIFHQPLPTVLPEIEPASLVSIKPLEDVLDAGPSIDLFHGAIPRHIKLANERFKGEAAKLTQYEEYLLREIKRELNDLEIDVRQHALLSTPKEYLSNKLENSVKNEAKAVVESGELTAVIHAKGERLREIMKTEMELNLEELQTLGKSLFDIPGQSSEDRRSLLERIDVIAATFESLLEDLGRIPIHELPENNDVMEKLVREYSVGNYGEMSIPDDIERLPSSRDDMRVNTSVVNAAEASLKKLKEEIEKADITESILRLGKAQNFDEIIRVKLREFDPLASNLEAGIEKVKAEISRVSEILKAERSKIANSGIFRFIEQQVDKRRAQVEAFRKELAKQRKLLEEIQNIKSEVDSQRGEYKRLIEHIKGLRNSSKTPNVSRKEDIHVQYKEDQGFKDKKYLIERLKQLGITPESQ